MENNHHNDDNRITQWTTCVEMANSVSQRRDTMNNIFTTLNLAIITATSAVWDLKAILLLAAGIAICILWIVFIDNFRKLNAAKFEIISELEKDLSNKPFTREWKALMTKYKYKNSTKLEKALPIIFITIYVVAVIAILIFQLKTGNNTTSN